MTQRSQSPRPSSVSDPTPSLAAAAVAAASKASATGDREVSDEAMPSDSGSGSCSGSGSGKSKHKKKPRLQWDEENLIHNALEMERNAYPKIDEPKTPFHASSGSEGGSVSSGSAPHSPGSPAFLSRDNLVGFSEVEQSARVGRPNTGPTLSEGRGSSDGPARSVHISEDAGASSGGESSPRSREEFEMKRKNHYKKEHARFHMLDEDDANIQNDADEVTPDIEAAREQVKMENGSNGRIRGDDGDDHGEDEKSGSEDDRNRNCDRPGGSGNGGMVK